MSYDPETYTPEDLDHLDKLNGWKLSPTKAILYNLNRAEFNQEFHKRLAMANENLSRTGICYEPGNIAGMVWRKMWSEYSNMGIEKFALDALRDIATLAGSTDGKGHKALTNAMVKISAIANRFDVVPE